MRKAVGRRTLPEMDLARMRMAVVLVSVAALALTAVGVVLLNADQTAREGWVEAGTVDDSRNEASRTSKPHARTWFRRRMA